MKILLVDDSATMRKILRMTLESLENVDFLEAGDGAEGLRLVAEHDPDLVVTDWIMPVMDGRALASALKRHRPRLPVLMVTTVSDKDRVLEALKAGVRDYLVKPFSPEVLTGKVRRLLSLESAKVTHLGVK